MESESTKPSKPPPRPAPAPTQAVVDRSDRAFGTAWYWFTFLVALGSLVTLWIYSNGNLSFFVQLIYWAAEILALGLLIWATIGLLTRYQLLQKVSASATRFRDREGADGDQEVVYRENIVVRLFKLIGRLFALLFLFVWNTFLRILYIVEMIIIWTLILAYDLIYYVLYAAWSLTYYAVRIALAIVRFALRVAWKILKVLTKLPIARGIWTKKMRPAILARYNHRVEQIRIVRAARLDQKRRLAVVRGQDPDKWQADWELRHKFPLPHPHDARKGLRLRIDNRQKLDYNRRDRWTAYRKGLPMPPKLHIEKPGKERKKDRRDKKEEKAAEKQKRRNEKDAEKPVTRSSSRPRGGAAPAAAPDHK